jgi:hypothetical protein
VLQPESVSVGRSYGDDDFKCVERKRSVCSNQSTALHPESVSASLQVGRRLRESDAASDDE